MIFLRHNKQTFCTLLHSIILLFGTVIEAFAGDNNKKYNILYIMTDDHAAHAIGQYNGRLSRYNPTPTLDQLAREGTLFTQTFTTNSICTPSRATILTGQYSQTNGVFDLWGSLPHKKQYLAKEMSSAGYQTAVIGKWHLKEEPAAFDYYKVLEKQGTYFDPEFRLQGSKPWPKNTVRYRGHSSDVVANQGIDWLDSRKDARPFFLMLQFKAPHDMFEYAPRYETYLKDATIAEPIDLYRRKEHFGSIGTRGENDSLRHRIGTSVSKRNTRRNMGQHLDVDPYLPDDQYTRVAYQRYLKAYLRCVKGVDDNIARVMAFLKARNLYDNTIIMYTSDQGFMLGEHDMIDKRWMYDESMQMPMIVRHPAYPNAPLRSDLLINNTDFAPTILDMAGRSKPNYMHGESFLPAIAGEPIKKWRNATYYRYWMHRAHHDVPAHFGVRTSQYKLIFFYGANYEVPPRRYGDKSLIRRYKRAPELGKKVLESFKNYRPNATNTPPAWEFYDLQSDPNELNNRYADKRYAAVITELKKEILAQQKKYNETDKQFPHIKKIIQANWSQ